MALIPKGTKAGDLRRGCEGLDIWNSWGNCCVAPESVGSQTMNGDSSRSQHGELTASRTGGTDQPKAHSELRIQIPVRANSQRKSQIHNEVPVSIIRPEDAEQCEMKKATSTEPSSDIRQDVMIPDSNAGKAVLQKQFDRIKK
jgi:hypothetical protein